MARDAQAVRRDTRLVIQRGQTLSMQRQWRRLDEQAVLIRAYQPMLVFGALQTARYAAAAMQVESGSPEVAERQRRQQRHLDGDRRSLLIQTEGALRRTVGSAEVMVEQLDAIQAAAQKPGIVLGVLRDAQPASFLVGSAFHVYDDTAAVVGLQVAAATLSDPADVAYFRGLFDRLAGLAVWGDEARAALAEIADWYRG